MDTFSFWDFPQNGPDQQKMIVAEFIGCVAFDLAIRWSILSFLGKNTVGPKPGIPLVCFFVLVMGPGSAIGIFVGFALV